MKFSKKHKKKQQKRKVQTSYTIFLCVQKDCPSAYFSYVKIYTLVSAKRNHPCRLSEISDIQHDKGLSAGSIVKSN